MDAADNFSAIPPSSTTYPAVSCVIGDNSGAACSCGTNSGVYQARVHAGPGRLELNPAGTDIADIIKTVSVACVTTTTTTTLAPHFQCYETKRQAVASVPVTLVDQFGTFQMSARRPHRLCALVDKNGENPNAPTDPAHLVGYDLRGDAHQFKPLRNVHVTNQFGTVSIDVVRFANLLVPAAKSLVAQPPPLPPGVIDHFLCYKVRHIPGTPPFAPIPGVTLIDQFGTKVVTVVDPRFLCTPVDKNGESPGAELHPMHLLCYETRFGRDSINISPVFTTDQFGDKTLQLIRREELCVPSTKTL